MCEVQTATAGDAAATGRQPVETLKLAGFENDDTQTFFSDNYNDKTMQLK